MKSIKSMLNLYKNKSFKINRMLNYQKFYFFNNESNNNKVSLLKSEFNQDRYLVCEKKNFNRNLLPIYTNFIIFPLTFLPINHEIR